MGFQGIPGGHDRHQSSPAVAEGRVAGGFSLACGVQTDVVLVSRTVVPNIQPKAWESGSRVDERWPRSQDGLDCSPRASSVSWAHGSLLWAASSTRWGAKGGSTRFAVHGGSSRDIIRGSSDVRPIHSLTGRQPAICPLLLQQWTRLMFYPRAAPVLSGF